MPTTKTDPNVQIAKRASAMFEGAAVSQPQLTLLRAYVSRSMKAGIIRTLGCTETQLKRYAESDLSNSDLPEKTRERLSKAGVYPKPWARKTAAMLYQIHKSRKRSPKPKTAPAAE